MPVEKVRIKYVCVVRYIMEKRTSLEEVDRLVHGESVHGGVCSRKSKRERCYDK